MKISYFLILLFLALQLYSAQIKTKFSTFVFNEKNGEISWVIRNKDNAKAVISTKNHYLMMNLTNDF